MLLYVYVVCVEVELLEVVRVYYCWFLNGRVASVCFKLLNKCKRFQYPSVKRTPSQVTRTSFQLYFYFIIIIFLHRHRNAFVRPVFICWRSKCAKCLSHGSCLRNDANARYCDPFVAFHSLHTHTHTPRLPLVLVHLNWKCVRLCVSSCCFACATPKPTAASHFYLCSVSTTCCSVLCFVAPSLFAFLRKTRRRQQWFFRLVHDQFGWYASARRASALS